MGATTIHYKAPKSEFKTAAEAFFALVEEETYNYGHDPYSGTIATCSLTSKVNKPKNDEEYDELLDRIDKRECVVYEDDEYFTFVGWAAC